MLGQVKKDSVAVAQKRQEAEADAVARRQIERGLLHSDRRSPSPTRCELRAAVYVDHVDQLR